MSRKRSNFIPDGYSELAYVTPPENQPLLFADCRFEYRPARTEEKSLHFAKYDGLKADARERLSAQFIADHITKWDVTDIKGNPIPVKGENVVKIRPALAARIFSIVLGTESSDIDPTWPKERQEELQDFQFDATATGQPVGDVAEQARVGN